MSAKIIGLLNTEVTEYPPLSRVQSLYELPLNLVMFHVGCDNILVWSSEILLCIDVEQNLSMQRSAQLVLGILDSSDH